MYIKVRVKTKQKNDSFVRISDSVYEISVKEKPQNNEANLKIKALLEDHFKTSRIKLVSGHHHPIKLFSIETDK